MTETAAPTVDPAPDELVFVPLGGTGEIGMNLNLYHYQGRWLMLDLGITFGDDTTPGVDIIVPDPAFIEERRDRLAGLVLTHAHEDHVGAVPYLWERLRCPLYATPFTAAVLARKLKEAGLDREATVHIIPLDHRFQVGPFDLTLVTLTHSIPEPNAVVIRTPAGTILHSGDWKLDPDPILGNQADIEALRKLGDEGVTAMVCDSTNAMTEGRSGSEGAVAESLIELLNTTPTGRVAVASFASNVARLQAICRAAQAHDRHPVLVGRSLTRMVEAARETGYWDRDIQLVSEHDAGYLPRENLLLVVTGSQGEPRSALARIARNDHPHVSLEAGDTAVFSSRIIPGNERSIGRLHNRLVRNGVRVVTEKDHFIHVSGHPAREELIEMYQLVRPRIAVPVHGEARHLIAHAELAEACQVPQSFVIENGTMLRLGPDAPDIVGQVTSGRLAVDGGRLLPMGGALMRYRHRMQWNGAAVITLVIDEEDGDLIADPQISVPGILDPEADAAVLDEAVEKVGDAVDAAHGGDDEALRDAARIAFRRVMNRRLGRKPVTEIHLVRV